MAYQACIQERSVALVVALVVALGTASIRDVVLALACSRVLALASGQAFQVCSRVAAVA